MKTGAGRDVRSPFNTDPAAAAGAGQRNVDRVQDQAGRPSGADGKMIVAGSDWTGKEFEIDAAEVGPAKLCLSDGRRRLHAFQVLRLQSRFGTARP